MSVAVAVVGLIAGIAVAASASRFPRHKATLERWGGGLVVLSVFLLALGLSLT